MNGKLEKKNNVTENENKKSNDEGFLAVIITTFTTVFVAELGDKTQIATLILSAESGKPVIVFLGAAIAFLSSSLVVVLLGKWLSTKIEPEKFSLLAGVFMILVGIWLTSKLIIEHIA
tara:strand:+ start:90315 stop:90668 length:354 start_codon:yes stop_codon:yes gene_type:complete